jgi:alpha-D-xyloside xylohydrolase
LPAGVNWYNFYDNKIFKGGQEIDIEAPINNIPVFVKEGTILVTGPVMQYSTEKAADTLAITIYGNKNASFTLYEDEDENYNYENGKSLKIHLQYNAVSKTFTAADAIGKFEGMLNQRVFKITFLNGNSSLSKEIKYNNKKTTITF